MMYENQIPPFMEGELDDIVHMLSERPSVDQTLDIAKDVPSLVQLCIKSSYKIRLKSMPELPNKIKRLFYPDEDFCLQKVQLSWLHSTLARFEPKEKFTKNCMTSVDKPELLHSVRNVNNQMYSVNHTGSDGKDSHVLATLPFTIIDQAKSLEHRKAITTWAVVAATLELMLPPVLSADAYRHQSESEDDRIVRATRSVISRLKSAMKSRFPTVVSYCFDDALPYALWARGDISQATEYFLSLSQSTTKEILKGLYLNEVGRMHALIGAVETAAKFYRLSCDALLKDGKNSHHADDVTTNMLMMIANLYDQGILTPNKGKQSTQAWNVVRTNKYSHKVEGLERHIMDVYLCTHCGSVQGREWLEQAKSMLVDLSTSDPQLVYYLNMVHALLGEEKQAYTVYWEFVKRFEGDVMESPGRDMVSLSGKGAKYNPWKPLVTMVKEIYNNVHFLPVLWRVQLQHLKISTGEGFESDICPKTLDLHFDSNGYLTGNMQMLLPPIRRIRLNPYTGTLQFDQHNSPTKVLTTWDSDSTTESIAAGTFVIPTMLEVYNKDGIKVHFMLGRKAGNMNNIDLNFLDMATLIWTGPNGEKARLNIYKLLREHCIKNVEKKLKLNEASKSVNDFTKEDGKKFVNLCVEKQRVLDYDWITSQVYHLTHLRTQHQRQEKEREGRLRTKYEPKKGKKAKPVEFQYEKYVKPPDLKLEYNAHPEEYRLQLTNICVVGDTLTFMTKQCNTRPLYLWVVDLTSKDTFLAYKSPSLYKVSCFTQLPVHNKVCHTIPGATILFSQLNSSRVEVLDIMSRGERISSKHIECHQCDITRMFLFGSQLFGVSFNSRIWSWDMTNGQREVADEFTGVRDLDLIGVVLVVSTDYGIKFCSVPRDSDHVFDSLPIMLSTEFKGTPLTLNDEGTLICKSRERIKVTGTQREFRDGKEVYRAAVSLDNITVIMLVPTDVYGPRESLTPIEILMAVTLPGFGTETCFISQQSGMILGWTQHEENTKDYREHLFQVDYEARLRGVLPFLGCGPRCFLPVYLPGDKDIQSKHPGHGQPGWYVFMRDGHEGIIGTKLVG
ncbi:uncharacterized protein LOC117329705 [Pecten maximus]|uniref:uncharacterized protein LOC117329705 n=1 Tax=Pecten maximus TaxID=6579 RepID=UPI0014585310|nr:uncharacterized protein LOC117329705 [Pecten maximus]XP_033743674.1 uncharacterized protein LOC117329705 [Pecten maximus]